MKAYPARTPRAGGGGRCRSTAIGGGRGRYTRAARKTRGQSRGDRTTEFGPRSQPRAAHLYTGGAGRRSWRGGVTGEAGRGAGVLASAMEPHCRRHGDERPQSWSLEAMATGASQADGDCGERASEPWWASTPRGGWAAQSMDRCAGELGRMDLAGLYGPGSFQGNSLASAMGQVAAK
ncbi:hypothetical protein PAHAL_1G009300 [Panicum hallii]|uniref:Uncharacterized protein n=1 Tax=Panicum hallii TaxID=206008 RepID=A0A2T8KTP6_9POAL|nr:uncharacterized protein LOC112900665 isoform X2 [Panicum hallii]PVH65502.1 hypothetical protein PAHAL_1G009300 [Panicum hallii]